MKEGLTFTASGQLSNEPEKKKGWTQAYVAELVDRDSRTIMNIENKGQYPSFDLFVKLITMFDVSVDQFIHADGGQGQALELKQSIKKKKRRQKNIKESIEGEFEKVNNSFNEEEKEKVVGGGPKNPKLWANFLKMCIALLL